MPAVSVLIASDVRLYHEGIRQFLSSQPSVEVVGTADSSSAALRLTTELCPAVLVLDQALPGSLEVLRTLRRLNSPCRVVTLGLPDQEDALLLWAEAGVSGFVPRDATVDALCQIVADAVRGDLHCSARVAGNLLKRLQVRASAGPRSVHRARLTVREAQIVSLLEQGLSNKGIAQKLGIQVATVKNHIHNLLEKLEVHRRGEAAALCRMHASHRQPQLPKEGQEP